jgi:protein TonB
MSEASENSDHRMSDVYQGVSPNSRLLSGDLAGGPHVQARTGSALSVSMLTHLGLFFLAVVIVTRMPEAAKAPIDSMFFAAKDIIWLDQPGPGGGGGGGGNKTPEPPKKAELPGKDKLTVPAAKPPKLENSEPPKEEPKPAQIDIPAVAVASGVLEAPGALTGLPSVSQGPGSGGGAGSGSGGGIGPGTGSGVGPGWGGGIGGGPYRPGNGIMSPRLLVEVKPSYTADAMRAKIQGVVTLEAVVMPDGSVGNVHVTRSLDQTFGLDQEAIKTVKKWRFAPGTKLGQPVPVLVEIEMTFTLR